MCQRLNTGESNNFYFGIFICIGPLSSIGCVLLYAGHCLTLNLLYHDIGLGSWFGWYSW